MLFLIMSKCHDKEINLPTWRYNLAVHNIGLIDL